jgi:probable F420-dependent oxidoreductase
VRLGLTTPVVNLNPRFDPPAWEAEGGIADIAAVVEAADRLGYDWAGCPEHVLIPEDVAAARGGRYWDPVATLGYLAARTSSIGLLSQVTVLGYHHPLALVKRYGTLDVASGGRVILGVGVGSLRPEFDALGADFEDRGARADDALRALRASFGHTTPSYQGTHFQFGGAIVEPSGMARHLPIWVGGRTRRSLRRALELADGWIPFGLSPDEVTAMLSDASERGLLERRASPSPQAPRFEVVLSPEPPLDPAGDPDGVRATLIRFEGAGATGLSLRFRSSSRAHFVEQLEAMRALSDEHA